MDKFLETYNLPKLNQEGAESLNRLTASKIEVVVKILPTHKSPGLDVFTGEFYKTLKEELTAILLRLFQKTQEDRWLQTVFEASIILIPKLDRNTHKKRKLKVNITGLLANCIHQLIKKIINYDQVGFILRM